MLASFALGLLASASPCVLPLYPGFLAYLSGSQSEPRDGKRRYWLGIFVLSGVLFMMLALGGLIALLSVSIGRVLSAIIPLVDLLILSLGLMLIFNFNLFKTLPQIQIPVFSNPFVNAFLYGLLYGPIALPCSGPLVVGIFAYSLSISDVLGQLSAFLWFGLGFGFPLLVLSFLSGAASRQITQLFARHARIVNLVGGLLLVGIAVYDLSTNWGLILAFLPG
jgi:cytochrome c-type biogenesis protein